MVRKGKSYDKFYMSPEYQAYLRKEKRLKLNKIKKPAFALCLSTAILGATLANADSTSNIFKSSEKKLVGIDFDDASDITTTDAITSLEDDTTSITFEPASTTSNQAVMANDEELVSIDFNNIKTSSGSSIESDLEDASYGPIPSKKIQKKVIKLQKERERLEKKKKVLSNFKKCRSVEDVLKRKKELESLHLTKEDKIYKDCKLSPELQRFIYEQSVMNDLPVDYTFSIIHTETRGSFNSSGEESYNRPGNYDLGLTQQNNVYSVKGIFCKRFNVDYDDAYKMVRDNDFINVLSCFAEYDEIKGQYPTFNPVEYAGCYNGWLNWRSKSISRQYVDIFSNAYNNIYTKHHKIEKKPVKKVKHKAKKKVKSKTK